MREPSVTLSPPVSEITVEAPWSAASAADDFLRLLWRRKVRFVSVAALVAICASSVLLFMPTSYTASTKLMVVSRQPDMATLDAVRQQNSAPRTDVDGEIDILTAAANLERVVIALQLETVAEFNPQLEDRTLPIGRQWLRDGSRLMKRLLGIESVPDNPRRLATDILASRIQVGVAGRSTIVDVKASARDPRLAQAIADAVARQFIEAKRQQRQQVVMEAVEFLRQRTEGLQRDALASEEKLAAFERDHAKIEGRDVDLLRTNVAAADARLTLARQDLMMANTRLQMAEDRVRRNGPLAVFEVDDSAAAGELNTLLAAAAANIRRQYAGESERSGSSNPVMRSLELEKRAAERDVAVLAEQRLSSLRTTQQIAQTVYTSLEAEFTRLRGYLDNLIGAQVPIHALKREVEASNAVYQSYLNLLRSTEQVGFNEVQTWVVSPAAQPLRPSSPKMNIVLFAIGVLGCGAGLSAIFLVEQRASRTLRSIDDVAALQEQGVGWIPEMRLWRSEPKSLGYTVLSDPNSPFAQGMAGLFHALASQAVPSSGGNVLSVTSALPSEGKSTTVAALAYLASSFGLRVLVIDADLHAPHRQALTSGHQAMGLSDYVMGVCDLSTAIYTTRGLPFDMMPKGQAAVEPGRLMRELQNPHFWSCLRSEYQFILIDTAPLLPMSEALLMARMSNACLVVAQWRRTEQSAVQHALRLLRQHGATIAGIALNRVDPKQQATYRFGDSAVYRHYPSRRSAARLSV